VSVNSTTIRTDAIARLIAASTAAGGRVFDSRSAPIQKDETLPLLIVYTPSDNGPTLGQGPPKIRSELDLVIEVHADGSTDASAVAAAESLEREVKAALLSDPVWVAQFEHVLAVNVQRGWDSNSDKRHVAVLVTIRVQFREQWDPVLAKADSADLEEIHTGIRMIDPATGEPAPADQFAAIHEIPQ
jgi:hypothetical protein